MKVCDLYTGGSQLKRAAKTLQETWQQTAEHWNDKTSQEYKEKYIQPLLPEITQALAAVYQMSELLEQAERECNDRSETP